MAEAGQEEGITKPKRKANPKVAPKANRTSSGKQVISKPKVIKVINPKKDKTNGGQNDKEQTKGGKKDNDNTKSGQQDATGCQAKGEEDNAEAKVTRMQQKQQTAPILQETEGAHPGLCQSHDNSIHRRAEEGLPPGDILVHQKCRRRGRC